MRNRAKCSKCQEIIESFHSTDYIECKCGCIALEGGESMKCLAKDWNYFLRVDDEGNEITVKVQDKKTHSDNNSDKEITKEPEVKLTKKDLIDMLEQYIKNIESLPQQAMLTSVNHYDLVSALLIVSSILRAE